jgi:hypothetical protein
MIFIPMSDIATGRAIGKRYPRRRADKFHRFLDEMEANITADLNRLSRYGQLRHSQHPADPQSARQAATQERPPDTDHFLASNALCCWLPRQSGLASA